MNPKLVQLSDALWELPISYKKGMRIPIRIVATEKILENIEEVVFEQSANVAQLPGLMNFVLILPDAHSGYGASIGTVFATDPQKDGVISPGAVGYDINCGMRLLCTNLTFHEVIPQIKKLVDKLFEAIPTGVGRSGFLKLNHREMDEVLQEGAEWAVRKGFGVKDDLEHIEENGKIITSDADRVSPKAKERGFLQLATLGSGNHYLEIQKVDTIFDEDAAKKLGIIKKDQVVIMLHTGSRGLGHQVATDHLRIFEKKLDKYKIKIPDPQLACAPFRSFDGQNYFEAMNAAANFAFANRQVITYQIREIFKDVFHKDWQNMSMNLIYDVTHNMAKTETHSSPTAGTQKQTLNLIVHRKGATKSYPNQPVIIGGSMETGSYLLMGDKHALDISFGSTAHGSGRTMSRSQAKRLIKGQELSQQMTSKGIFVKSASFSGLAEEASLAYKNINEVVKSVSSAGISKPVAYFKPIGNIKG